MEAEQVAVLPSDSIALPHLGRLPRDVGDPLELARRGSDPHDRGHRKAERCRIDLGAVAGDHPRSLEPLYPIGDGGRRHADAAAELRQAEAAVGPELAEHAKIGLVENSCFVGICLVIASFTWHFSSDFH